MRLHTALLLALPAACLLLCAGCADPEETELKAGAAFDPETAHGKVTKLWVGYFEVGEKKGQPYYCLTLTSKNSGGTEKNEDIKGLLPDVFKSLRVEMELPANPVVTPQMLTKMEGIIIDIQADPIRRRFTIVVDHGEEIKTYSVDIDTFYRRIEKGMKLPLQSKEPAIK